MSGLARVCSSHEEGRRQGSKPNNTSIVKAQTKQTSMAKTSCITELSVKGEDHLATVEKTVSLWQRV